MKFPTVITDHVKREWSKHDGTTGVCVEAKDFYHLLLDFNDVIFTADGNKYPMKNYVGFMLCNYLKNDIDKSQVLNDYWMNRFVEHDVLAQIVDQVTQRAWEIAAEEV